MTDGERLTAILAQYAIPCEKVSFRGKLDALAAGLGIQTQGRLMGDVLDDIAAKTGVKRDDRLYGTFIRKLYEGVTSGEDATLSGNPLTLTECIGGKPLGALHVYGKSTQDGVPTPTAPVPIVSAGDGGTVVVMVSDGANKSQTLTLQTPNALPGIPVSSGGNYTDENGQQWICDEVDLERGVKVQRVNTYKLTEVKVLESINGYGIANFVASYTFTDALTRGDKKIFLANSFAQQTSLIGTTQDEGILMPHTGTCYCRIKKEIANTVDGMNAWLSRNDVLIYYALAIPIKTRLTPAELAAYKALTTYAPTTVISASGVSGLAATYSHRKAAE